MVWSGNPLPETFANQRAKSLWMKSGRWRS
jgi:hypothetical protein